MSKLKEQLEKRLSNIDAAYQEAGRPKVDFSVYPEDLRTNRQAAYDAIVLVEAARKIERENNPGEIDWENWSQYKWQPWFNMSPSSFGFCVSYCVIAFADAGGGSRLRVLSKESSDYIGTKFPEVWRALQLE